MPRISLSYEDWFSGVEIAIQKITDGEVFAEDLPDWDSWASYENGDSPERAAKKAIKNAGGIGSW